MFHIRCDIENELNVKYNTYIYVRRNCHFTPLLLFYHLILVGIGVQRPKFMNMPSFLEYFSFYSKDFSQFKNKYLFLFSLLNCVWISTVSRACYLTGYTGRNNKCIYVKQPKTNSNDCSKFLHDINLVRQQIILRIICRLTWYLSNIWACYTIL